MSPAEQCKITAYNSNTPDQSEGDFGRCLNISLSIMSIIYMNLVMSEIIISFCLWFTWKRFDISEY